MILNSLLILFINFSSAQMFPDFTFTGIVTQFDAKTIQIKQSNGALVNVPRSVKPKMQGVKIGKDVITVSVGASDFVKLNPNYYPQAKPKSKLNERLHGAK